MTATIVHTTDLVHDDRVAFEHSVALAHAGRARLVSLHANAPATAAEEMMDATAVLTAWGRPGDAIDFSKKIHTCCDEPVETLLDALRTMKPDLVVASTHQRSALARFFAGSQAEALAHNLQAPTLLFPEPTRGFVASDSGAIDLHRILVPLGDAQESETAIRTAGWLAELAGLDATEFMLLHIGTPTDPAVEPLRRRPGWRINRVDIADGSIDESIERLAKEANIVVMATRGHDSVGDVLRGSHTDRVLHRSRCPVLSVGVAA